MLAPTRDRSPTAEPTSAALVERSIVRVHGTALARADDVLAVEEPLEIRVHVEHDGRLVRRAVSVTMRTPGNDAELAAGFLFTEGIVPARGAIVAIRHCGPADGPGAGNTIRVELAANTPIDFARLERHTYTTSSCGVCGKTSVAALESTACWSLHPTTPGVDAAVVHALPRRAREAQAVFDRTGGLHASTLFDVDGRVLLQREDVGRHNALDKVVGARLLGDALPASDTLLLVSGRASFELVQKAVMAGIPILAAVGAPSSLAVELAARAGLTLLGFVRDERFNVYTGAQRIRGAEGT